MTKLKKDENLLMLSNHNNHTIMLTDLKRVNIEGISKQKNNRMLAYFDLLVDDILIYDGDFELDVEISMSADNMFMSIMLEKSYPYYRDSIFLCFDLKEKASVETLARSLSNVDTIDNEHWENKDDVVKYIDCSFGYDHELMRSDYPPSLIEHGSRFMNNIRMVDQALYFDNSLIQTFYNNITPGDEIRISGTSFDFRLYCLNEIKVSIESPFLAVIIDDSMIKVNFDLHNSFSFTTSKNFERDLCMFKFFIQSYIEKMKDCDVHDLKSEILLLEMAAI